jgi:uncharacterized protein YbdZ (MbtH family)
MSNPFEDEDGRYIVLMNEEGQHSLWPIWIDIPDGWTTVHHEDTRKGCLDYIETAWTDIRPLSLIAEFDSE